MTKLLQDPDNWRASYLMIICWTMVLIEDKMESQRYITKTGLICFVQMRYVVCIDTIAKLTIFSTIIIITA